MQDFDLTDHRNKYPGYYNIYSIQNEISIHSMSQSLRVDREDGYLLDDQYGRLIMKQSVSPYGDGRKLAYYFLNDQGRMVDTLRVPFRKIPIFTMDTVQDIQVMIRRIEAENESYTILLRGQTNLYTLTREGSETAFLYGEEIVKEPSFQPSFLRTNFNETFIYSLWHSQTALLLHDVGVDLRTEVRKEYYDDVEKIKGSTDFTPLALGLAQHYGMPSIGLDLTRDLKVALWFATNELKTGDNGEASTRPITDFSQSTLYIFRCPNDAVFSHKHIKPKFLDDTRPDRQDAWFSHVGWGFAKNQLASYLVCGIRLSADILDLFEPGYERYLFPPRKKDIILHSFLDITENEKYIGEVRRALNKIYFLPE